MMIVIIMIVTRLISNNDGDGDDDDDVDDDYFDGDGDGDCVVDDDDINDGSVNEKLHILAVSSWKILRRCFREQTNMQTRKQLRNMS